jgi:hypothetical protein
MSDVKILKKEGWEELNGVVEAIVEGSLDIDALWRAAGHGDVPTAQQALLDAGYDLEGTVKGVRVIALPDDIRGEIYRVWVKYKYR